MEMLQIRIQSTELGLSGDSDYKYGKTMQLVMWQEGICYQVGLWWGVLGKAAVY